MIALNEIMSNQEDFERIYKKMGHRVDLIPIISLEDERKIVQLKAETLRSETSKLCSQIAILRRENKDTKALMSQIESNEKQIKALNKKLDSFGKQIDSKLKLLPNISTHENELNKQIETLGSQSDFGSLKIYISSMFKPTKSRKSIRSYVKSLKNRLFQESELGIAAFCKNGIALLFQNYLADDVLNQLLSYLKNNSQFLVCAGIKNLSRTSSCEYIATLNQNCFINIQIKGEYFTREHKIKYKYIKLDNTKFVYEIDIVYI